MGKSIGTSIGSALCCLAILFAQTTPAQTERLGGAQQPLPGGSLVSVDVQERLGLVTIGGCSGTLLRNDWVLTAAHCLEDGNGMLVNPASVLVTATWGSQSQTAVEFVSFRPDDLAIAMVARPFTVNGSTYSHRRALDERGVYASDLHKPIGVYGRGISVFAVELNGVQYPSYADGEYREGQVPLGAVWHGMFSFNTSGVTGAGGDSGGPTIRLDPFGEILGVHVLCSSLCLPGRQCGVWKGPGPAPEGYGPWQWVAGTTDCTDISVHPFVDRIVKAIDDRRISPAPPMRVEPSEHAVRYVGPTIPAENGVRLRLDLCRQPGTECEQPAADAFCASMSAAKPVAASYKIEKDVGATAIISTGQICRTPDCDSFVAITCSAPADDRVVARNPAFGTTDVTAPADSGASIVNERDALTSAAVAGAAPIDPTCATGYVWRTAGPQDLVCVPPAARSRVAEENRLSPSRRDPAGAYGPNTCISGYVWREAFEGDLVCVTPESRQVVREENGLGPSRRVP